MQDWEVKFAPEAIQELQLVVTYYENLRAGLGIELMLAVEKQVQQISANPFTRAIRYLDVRFALIERFPYALHYVIREHMHVIVIQTILATMKNPDEHWKQR